MTDDTLLLRRYVEERSEASFTELVQRHVNLVYHTALRRTGGDAHRAADVAQSVFTTLARKAGALTRHATLTGWLYTATQFAARESARAESRRHNREQQAYTMNEPPSDSGRDADWELVRPVIDEALRELDASDRDAVLLRFFENRPYAEVGAALRLSENSARMRVDRALEKLRAALARRGITSTAAALGGALTVPGALAAPVGLAQQISSAALAATAAAGTGGTILALLHLMTSTKITAAISAAALLALGVAVQQHRQLEATRTSLVAEAKHQSYLQAMVDDLEGRLATAREHASRVDAENRQLAAGARPGAVEANAAAIPPAPVTRDQVEARFKKAHELAQSGQAAEALTEYLWCFDTGMRQVDGYFMTRYSTLLNDLVALGKTYPPALDALRQRRDAAEARLRASGTDMTAGKDYGQINHVLGEDGRTNALFDALTEDDPRRAHIIESSIGRLMETQRYRELAKAMPYDDVPQVWEQLSGMARAPAPNEAARQQIRGNVLGFATSQIELRAGAGDLVNASDLIERVLIFDNSPETVAAIKQHLTRAGHPELLSVP